MSGFYRPDDLGPNDILSCNRCGKVVNSLQEAALHEADHRVRQARQAPKPRPPVHVDMKALDLFFRPMEVKEVYRPTAIMDFEARLRLNAVDNYDAGRACAPLELMAMMLPGLAGVKW